MGDLRQCNVCLEEVESNNIAYCNTCLESGQICHNCVIKWSRHNNNPKKCSICKNNTLTNIPNIEPNIQYQSINFFPNNNRIFPLNITATNNEYENTIKYKIKILFLWILIAITISWAFAPFSYLLIFNGSPKKLFSKFYITLACGSIFGIPITVIIYYRKYHRNI